MVDGADPHFTVRSTCMGLTLAAVQCAVQSIRATLSPYWHCFS
jgi:hypothetical protein